MLKHRWGDRNPQCGHLTIEELEYRKMVKTFTIIMVLFVTGLALEVLIWNI